jgi:hypothetical protein
MRIMDFLEATVSVLKSVGLTIWHYISWPGRFIISLPWYVKLILFIILLAIMALIAWKIIKDYRKDRWMYIKT